MSFIDEVSITTQGGLETDPFGRFRVSFPKSVFESKLMYDKQPLLWAEELTGNCTATYNTNEASVTMAGFFGNPGTATRQSRVWPNYQPARGQAAFMTFQFGQALSTSSFADAAVGVFSDDNGIFLKQTAASMQLVRRTNVTGTPVDNVVNQASWDDPMDGTGASGKTIDWTKAQLMIIDYTWLGFGKIRLCFEIDGKAHLAHTLTFSNSLSEVWQSMPNNPVRYYLNTGSSNADTLTQICCAVLSEGGNEPAGYHRADSPRITPSEEVQMPTAGTKYVQHAIRLKSTHLAATVKAREMFMFVTASNSPFKWELHLNPTVAGTAMSWAGMADSAVESGTPGTGTATTISADGHIIAAGLGADNLLSNSTLEEVYNLLGSAVDGTPDELYLVISSAGANDDGLGAINWTELW